MAFQTYLVGGAVRDALLGREAGDRDWVVVGATAEQLMELGYRPVGKDFPVFLHPDSQEEVALARTERKTGRGYRGFAVHADPSVSLEQDLQRRDLTINAMARADDGTLIDPYGGLADLQAGVLRHVSAAFAEDPVRILRLARFAARWPHFAVAAETQRLCRQMVASGEADALVPERVWQELARGLMESSPMRMWEVLEDSGVWLRWFPRLKPAAEAPGGMPSLHDRLQEAWRRAQAMNAPLAVRAACLVHCMWGPDADEAAVREWHDRLRPTQEVAWLAEVLQRHGPALMGVPSAQPEVVLALLDALDAWRRPQRLPMVEQACRCLAQDPIRPWDHSGPRGYARSENGASERIQAEALHRAWHACAAVDTADVAARAQREGLQGAAVGDRIRQARLRALNDAGWQN